MGLLSQGSPLNWTETKKYADHVRKHGILQFLNIYNKVKDRQKDVLKWGDEVEYMLVELDKKDEKARLVLNGNKVLDTLQEKGEKVNPNHPTLWRPEYGSYMIEGTPGQPYGGNMSEFSTVEDNMGKRRREASSMLKKDETLCTITSFPRLGCPSFTQPECRPTPVEKGVSKSLFFPDEAINRHPRFSNLTRNIRHRRGEKVVINVPIFKDQKTPSPFAETFPEDDGEAASAALPDHIYMDAMGFGMGNCCLQVTFQACSISEARYLYDQLATFCPIVMALSAASPFYRGYVSDIDCRWGVISASVDDRTREERGLEPLKNNKFRIHKSRYDSIDSYLSFCGEKYNDIDLTKDDEIYNQLLDAGIDKLLAQHIAHLFIRDPLSLFEEKINLDDENESDHFENLQSTNWQTMRFKPPPPNSDIGWRVEFRPMEVQLTDFENAAYVVFIVLLTRVILSYKLDFLIPLSKVDDNMKVAQKRNAVQEGMFYFRKDIFKGCNPLFDTAATAAQNGVKTNDDHEEYTLMSIDTIINGKEGVFQGLVPILNYYLENMEVDVDTRCAILNYLKLIKKRASGMQRIRLEMESLNQRLNQHIDSWMGPRDPRVRGWLLLDNYLPTLSFTIIYLLIVWMGPKYMKNRQPFSCRGLLVVYNLALTLLSLYMFYELVTAVWQGGYNFFCQDTHSGGEADNRIINVLWWYYFSKLIEFMDTFFFILRKNNHQITFLHIYHHFTMLNIWWFVMNWVPCGHFVLEAGKMGKRKDLREFDKAYFGATFNSFIHVLMYSYYGLSAIPAIQPYLWWKKYITQGQLVQFVLTMIQTSCAVVWPCGFPKGWLYFQISYMITLIIFFSNFYIQTYKKKGTAAKKDPRHNGIKSVNGHSNGATHTDAVKHRKPRTD
ncbi:hypothetical protein QTP86_029980 [Hemibagrus guttatus]|nr:hypothetical protein QTP86_029980 [Hemibagrus guttatus]